MGSGKEAIFVDGHVHVYACHDAGRFLAAAARNFASAARTLRRKEYSSVLMLAEGEEENWFAEAVSWADGAAGAPAGWTFRRSGEEISLFVTNSEGQEMIIVAGRQLAASEGIEVLALATSRRFREGERAEDIVEKVTAAGAIPLLPWGVGKWTGRRGRLVGELIASGSFPLAAGDSGNRPLFWPRSALLAEARHRRLVLLSGSDPLPLPGEEERAGSFGSVLSGLLSSDRPAAELRLLLESGIGGTPSYGRTMGPLHFFRSQLGLRMGGGR